jgi:hypothetical protein
MTRRDLTRAEVRTAVRAIEYQTLRWQRLVDAAQDELRTVDGDDERRARLEHDADYWQREIVNGNTAILKLEANWGWGRR